MKKSIRRKLIMSAVAVGAAALATTSSTYAWFVSNAEVKTSKVQGTISSSEANLQISADGDNYGVTATPSIVSSTLTPITKDAGAAFGTYKKLSGDVKATDYISFKLYFKASGLEASNYKLQLKQSTGDLAPTDTNADKEYTALADSTGAAGYQAIEEGGKIKEDVTKALYLSVKTGESTSVNIPFNATKGTYDGVAYYNTVTGTTDAKNSKVDAYEGALNASGFNCDIYTISNSTAGATVDFTVDFNIWLDGADDTGFDVIASHIWTVGLNFTLTKASAL